MSSKSTCCINVIELNEGTRPDRRMVRGKEEERGVEMRGKRGETENNDDDNRKCGPSDINTDGRTIATTHTMESTLGLTKYHLVSRKI